MSARNLGRRTVRDAEQAGEHLATFKHGNGSECYAVKDNEGLHVFRAAVSPGLKDAEPDLSGDPDLLPRDRKARDRGKVSHPQRLRDANAANADFWEKQKV